MTDPAAAVADLADKYFQQGYNCAQAVLRAVAEAQGMACPRCVPGVALALGGGVGHAGYVCGAAVGAVMAIGLAVDKATAGGLLEKKQAANRAAGPFVKAFAAQFGSADCRAILGFDWSEPNAMDRARAENVKAAKCTPCVRWAAERAMRLIEGLDSGAANP
jgi:C_GCAxxG_C_C family probable redox protein